VLEHRSVRRRGGLVRRAGFTILEILIAIVVLSLGIVGIIALFPTAIESGNKTVEDSYAAAITQSVVDAITVGLRESRYNYRTTTASSPRTWTYFIFNHDGVVDRLPLVPEDFRDGKQGAPAYPGTYPASILTKNPSKVWDKDYCVVLPLPVTIGPNGAGTGLASAPFDDVQDEPAFIFPVPLTPAGEEEQRSDASLAANTVIDNLHTSRQRETVDGEQVLWVPRVYNLGVYRDPGDEVGTVLPGNFVPGDVREEFRGEDVQVASTTEQTIAVDPYPTYSFAFVIRRARVDTNNDAQIDTNDEFSSSLYEVRVMIFKDFDQNSADQLADDPALAVPRGNNAIRQFVTLISL